MSKIRAIPTTYAGQAFRSKLEARWAMNLDRWGIAWTYEPEGYQLPSGDWYLPDFWLPGINTWLEVKGPGVPGLGKFEEFAREQGPRGVAFPPDEWEARGCEGYETHVGMAFVVGTTPRRDGELDVPSWQQACRYCGEWLPTYHDNLPEGCSFLAWCTTGTCIGQSQFVTRHGGIGGCGMDSRCFVCGDKVSPRLTGVEFARLPRIEPAGRRS